LSINFIDNAIFHEKTITFFSFWTLLMMSTLCQNKAIFFHSEIRRKKLESRFNFKRCESPKMRSIKIKNLAISPLLDEDQMRQIFEEFEKTAKNNIPQNMQNLIIKIRAYYIYDKANMKLMKNFIVKLIDFSFGLKPMETYEDLVYECSWILINYLGFEECALDVLTIEKLCQFFLAQITYQNTKFQKEVFILKFMSVLILDQGLWGVSNLLADSQVKNFKVFQKFDFFAVLIGYYWNNIVKIDVLMIFLWCFYNWLLTERCLEENKVKNNLQKFF